MALDIISTINLDLKRPNTETVYAVQYDTAGRIKAQLTNDGEAWHVPTSAGGMVSFRKSDNIGGFYDTTELGEVAVSVDENDDSIIYIALDAQTTITATPLDHPVQMQINFYNSQGKRLSTFAFYLRVQASVLFDGDQDERPVASEWTFRILTGALGQTIKNQEEAIKWMEDNIRTQAGYVVDDTLKVEGAAGDAKKIGELFEEIVKISDSMPGYFPTTDTERVGNTKYYTRSGTSPNYVYTEYTGATFATGVTYYEYSPWNRIWIDPDDNDVVIPTMDELDEVKNTLLSGNAYDILASFDRPNTTHNGVTFAWSENNCHVSTGSSGSTASAQCTLYLDRQHMPFGLKAGESYYIKYDSTNVYLEFIWSKTGSQDYYNQRALKNRVLTVPADAEGAKIRLFVEGVGVVVDETVSPYMFSAPTNAQLKSETDLAPKPYGVLADGTNLNSVVKSGFYVLTSGYTYQNAPTEQSGVTSFLEVFLASNNTVLQRAITPPTKQIYIRTSLNGSFENRKWFTQLEKGQLVDNTDLNDVKDNGNYFVHPNRTYLHGPADLSGHPAILEVAEAANNTSLQRITYYSSDQVYVRTSLNGSFENRPWYTFDIQTKHVFKSVLSSDLTSGKYIAARVSMFVHFNTSQYLSCALIPVKKGTTVKLKTATNYPIVPFAKVKFNYLIEYKEPFAAGTDASVVTSVDKTITFDYDGFLAVNCRTDLLDDFLCEIDYGVGFDEIRENLFLNTLKNPSYMFPEYDADNICRVVKRGPTLMGAIHHWGLIGASYDSGELNFTRPGATEAQKSSLDYYEYSWMSELARINGIKDLYHYSNGGQNSKQWITLTGDLQVDRTSRGYCYPEGIETISYSALGGLITASGIGPGGGCWWKVKADHAAGKAKQAYVIVLGSNDINNNNPHDSDWVEKADGTYDESLYYKAGTIADIGTYDLTTDTDTVPAGKTAGVVPGIVNSYAAYMGAILNRLIALQPDCVIFLATIRNNFAWNENSLAIWEGYNDVLRDIAAMNQYKDNVYLIDYGMYGPNYVQPEFYNTIVGTHPNAIGYHEVAYYYGTLIDYVIQNNLNKFRQTAFIGTDKKYDPVT